jgi:hypothetical protein
MDSYIVRIYRRAVRKSRILIGTVKAAGAGRKMAFSNIEELWEILGCRKGPGPYRPAVSTTPFREGGDERDGRVRPQGIRGGSPSNQIHFRTLKGGEYDEKTFRYYSSHAPVLRHVLCGCMRRGCLESELQFLGRG